jgi:peptide/nickel transport system ATP-binding protein
VAVPLPGDSAVAAGPFGSGPIGVLDDLHVTFQRSGRQVRALRGVSLSIGRGEILGLVGESGSGKSALGLALLGLLPDRPRPAVSGSALVAGTDMVRAGPAARRATRRKHLGAIFQDPMTSLNPTMRVGRQIVEVAGSQSEAIALLDAVGVPEPRRRLRVYPHQLSGGLRQRVMIAMAVAGSPSLVVADEPTTALDVTVQAQILDLLAHLRDTVGCSFVLVTHDLGVAAEVSDRIAVLYGGRIAEIGPARDLLTDPRHPYTKGLLRSRLKLDSDRSRPLPTLPGAPPDPTAPPPGCPFGPRCASHADECDAALPELADAGGRLAACFHPLMPGGAAPSGGDRLGDEASGTRAEWQPVPPRSGAALTVRDLWKDFTIGTGRKRTQLHALRGVDLDIAEGESVALVGESGCGKSTLLRVIAGLATADRGSVEVGPGARPQMVFQDAGASLTPWLTVGELVGDRLRNDNGPGRAIGRGGISARVADTLKQVGLPPDIAHARAAQLSGGQRQRAAMARAIIVPPEVLLCDEPISALDVSLAATVLNLIGTLRRQLGLAVLFVTHDLAAARIVADRVAVMYLGRIVETGPAEEVCANPVHPYTRALFGAVPGQEHAQLAGEPASPLSPPSGCAFHPRCPVAVSTCATTSQTLAPHRGSADRWVACAVAEDQAGVRAHGDR